MDHVLNVNKWLKYFGSMFIKFSKYFSRESLYVLLEDAINNYVTNKDNIKIINIGAGGEISNFLKKKGLNVLEIDIDPKRKPDIVLDIQDMYLIPTNSVDVVFCLEVLEHVKNPFKAVKEIERILKPGGILIGSTPFVFPIHEEPHDFFRYTKFGILNLFENFECVVLKERNTYIKSWYVLLLRIVNRYVYNKNIISAILIMLLALSLMPIVLILDKFVKLDLSTTGYFYVFKKRRDTNG